MEPLKEMFNSAYFKEFALEIKKVDKKFDVLEFFKDVTENLDSLSLNQRMRRASQVLKKYLPSDYKTAIKVLMKAIPNTKKGYTNLVFPDFVGLHGHDDFDTSMDALHYFTQFGSSEFAIREFLKRDFAKTIKVMCIWAKSDNPHVRRLASEGSRPRLPWSFKLDEVIKNPHATQPILDTLKEDKELYVKKSVANHLNDISKDNADFMIKCISSWDKKNPETAWIIKHASRTLIKKGNSASLSIFDFEKNAKLDIENFKINATKIKLGESLIFDFVVISKKNKSQKLAIDYVIHYRKKSGELSPKVFKLKEIDLLPGQKITISKKQIFKDFTTRKHFAGAHKLSIQINGKIMHEKKFEIVF